MTESKFLVILGIGNSIRMDDGAGIRVVEHLEREPNLKRFNITFKYLNTGGFDILDEIDGYEHAIIVDAANMVNEGLQPGDIFHFVNFRKRNIEQTKGINGISSHGMGVLHVLKYAHMAGYQVPWSIEIFGIQVKETEYFSEQLTPEVAAGVEKLVIRLTQRILDLSTGPH